jgi:hypothetical protein
MSQSFGFVEEKLRETEFFLEQMRQSSSHFHDARFFFSAFVSAARSVTLALQASLHGIAGFDTWYEGARQKLKTDPLAPYFVEIRNDVVHKGVNPLNQAGVHHLREHLVRQFGDREHTHFLVLPAIDRPDTTVLAKAYDACTAYFISIVEIVYDCYRRFKTVVDAQWYFTEENFNASGRTIRDAVVEMGFPAQWLDVLPGHDAWRVLRRQQAPCLINDLFDKYLGVCIASPDDLQSVEEDE